MFRPPILCCPPGRPYRCTYYCRAAGGFYVRTERVSLPPHAPDMLTVRIQAIDGTRTLTSLDPRPCRLAPSLVSALPSTSSAASCPPGFECYAGTTALYDSPSPCLWGYRSSLSPTGPRSFDRGWRLVLSVLARGVSTHAWGLRLRGVTAHLR
jgi:hypothetical protein